MMNISKITITVALLFATLISLGQNPSTCTLKGTVIDRDSDTLMLRRLTEDFRFIKIFIPIVDGKFEYEMDVEHVEAWDMTFQDEYYNGGWRPIDFFPDKKEVIFELYPFDQNDKNKVIGGKLNQGLAEFRIMEKEIFHPRYEPFGKISDSLFKNGLYHSEEVSKLYDQLQSTSNQAEKDSLFRMVNALKKEGKDLSPEALENNKHLTKITQDNIKWRYEYIRKNLNILCFSFILTDLLRIDYSGAKVVDIQKVYPMFANKYPDHPYTALIADILNGNDKIKVGGQFIDFSLPDLKGTTQTLSELIKGQVAIIDLWATWCGPCIRHSRELVPLYNEYHDKGFTIVGVAAEHNDTEAMEKRLAIEKWPWVNLVELDHQNNIWHKYGASFGGGRIIMVDRKGDILAINPSASEVAEHLKRLL